MNVCVFYEKLNLCVDQRIFSFKLQRVVSCTIHTTYRIRKHINATLTTHLKQELDAIRLKYFDCIEYNAYSVHVYMIFIYWCISNMYI